ncbi:16S rRNA (uracil(1498)-N(3))-methyltransferase [Acidihalobacter prosperus]|uniref:Ribosomal RNA small subunit methyltransferase E n=1 Tax=Acidihalobacter prosperus TaxID=160660 RepID=A0A1A6C0P0_9GAMM|nr:16S rRNA (uracil(1498)-N(3))-methyltransferase [Acidihalobacter prosperus]OBS08125.1 16S rRNA (uracil(1498)-N(3))-methyltransferase [Acidihalobacter prosperus]
MRVPRLYVERSLALDDGLALPDGAFRHCVQVLRLCEGAELVLFNGDGRDYRARLTQVGRREARVTVHAAADNATESALDLGLVQGISKGDHMDLTIQKAVELGVRRILPLTCLRSQRIPPDRLARRMAHWRAIAISACEQSGRSHLPELLPPVTFDEWLDDIAQAPPRLMLDPRAATALGDLQLAEPEALQLLIGPEGGFADEEVARARDAGVAPVRLGPRVLRTETAAIAALALAQARWGDLH